MVNCGAYAIDIYQLTVKYKSSFVSSYPWHGWDMSIFSRFIDTRCRCVDDAYITALLDNVMTVILKSSGQKRKSLALGQTFSMLLVARTNLNRGQNNY